MQEDDKETQKDEDSDLPTGEPDEIVRVGEDDGAGATAAQLGATRYVLAGFFASAIAVAFVIGRALTTGWDKLADSQWTLDKAPWLSRVGEDGRATWGTIAGGLIGIGALLYVYRRQDIRLWINDAASELAKVTWPTKKDVTHGTIVVIVASLVATFYLALLDRFWGFVTNLVYGV